MRKKIKSISGFDYSLLAIILALLAFGLASLHSASMVESFKNFGTPTYYIYHQLMYGAVIGLAAMVVLSKIDYHFWQKQLPWLLVISLLLLAMVKLTPFGFSANGATRWLRIGPLFFQPSEIAKLVLILYIASWVDKKKTVLNHFYFGLLPTLIIIVLFAGLILWQPDLGTMMVLLLIGFFMLFVAGVDWHYFFWGSMAAVLSIYGIIKFEPYRARRLTTFLNPSFDPQGIGYHLNQALLAVGAGQWWGYGYGLSRQKYNYLPEVMNDSIFAVIAEELGFVRVSALILLFIIFALKGFAIAKRVPDMFGKMVASGITIWITIQVLINIAAMINLMPLTGIPLPFFSYGSTALIINLAAMGILLNISRHAPVIKAV